MDLQGLRDFNLVATHGGFGRAARATRRPKATLSRKVSELEASLNVRLIERGSRLLRLTDEGVALHEATRGPLQDIAEAERLQILATEMGASLGLHTFPTVVKESLTMAGFPMGQCRKPLGKMPEDARRKLAAVMAHLKKEGMLPEIAGSVSAS